MKCKGADSDEIHVTCCLTEWNGVSFEMNLRNFSETMFIKKDSRIKQLDYLSVCVVKMHTTTKKDHWDIYISVFSFSFVFVFVFLQNKEIIKFLNWISSCQNIFNKKKKQSKNRKICVYQAFSCNVSMSFGTNLRTNQGTLLATL